jgi:alginate O-acetyltransferase complex protein AlgI
LYIALGGNRKGGVRRLGNLMVTALLGGLWHGAGWTFVLWGGIHGACLVINHGWRNFCRNNRKSKLGSFFAWALTMMVVVVSWVPFRATSMAGTNNMLAAMFGGHGLSLPVRLAGKFGDVESWLGITFKGGFYNGIFIQEGVFWIAILLLFSIALPNTQQVMFRTHPAFETYKGEILELRYRWMEWQPTLPWAILLSVIIVLSLLNISRRSEFLYFQF